MVSHGNARPGSWASLVDELFDGDWNPSLRRHRSPYVFRGMVNASFDLRTSLMRIGERHAEVERHLVRNFRKYAHRDIEDQESFWYWLSVAQHHGLPTRLLDWTYSPFVALHFATDHLAEMHTDGVIWCIDMEQLHKFLPPTFRATLDAEGSRVFSIDMLSNFATPTRLTDPTSKGVARKRAVRNLADFDALTTKPFALFFEPPSLDDRIVNQYALFSVISDPSLRMDELLLDHPAAYKRVEVSAKIKWEVRDKLDQANITERVIMPGLDGLSKWLARHYHTNRPG